MKNLKITVNGVAYSVQVEEADGTAVASAPAAAPAAAPVPAAPVAVPAPAAAPAPAAEQAPATPAPAPAPKPSASVNVVSAPMPGKILDINVTAGQAVKKGQTLLILEAMKMENEIMSPTDSVVAGIHVNKGDMVNVGDPLVSLQ